MRPHQPPSAEPPPAPHRQWSAWRRRAGIAVVAAVLLCAGLLGATRVLATRAEERHPPAGRLVDVGAHRIHVIEAGPTGEDVATVVLLHGAYGGLDDWRATILSELARHYHVIALDRPGNGWSTRGGPPETWATPQEQGRVVRAVLRSLGVERPVLVGFSWSGPLVLAMALEHPDEIGALVTVNGATHPWPGPLDLDIRIPAWPIVGDVFSELLVAPLGFVLADDALETAFAPQPIPPHYARSSTDLALRPDAYRHVTADLRALRPAVRELVPRYDAITTPLVVVVGEGDRIAGPHVHSYPLAETVPGAELISVPDGGHQLPYTHPEAVIDAIERAVVRRHRFR